MKTVSTILLATLLVCNCLAQPGDAWNLADDFGTLSNPGPWLDQNAPG